jgi:hypothetical protein
MERENVQSSNLVSVGYLPENKILEVEFKGGTIYQFDQVPPEVWAEFQKAPSKGQWFAAEIKNRYTHRKIEQVKG